MTDSNSWGTPKEFFNIWHEKYNFIVDACANEKNKKLTRYWDIKKDGLAQDWSKERVWCNPPYGRGHIKKWVKKAYEESLKGSFVCMLLPVWTSDSWFHDYVVPYHSALEFVKGRIKFEGAKDVARFANMIVTFGEIK